MTEECCECCCEDFSTVLRDRTPVPCGCGFSICVCCTKRYLLGSTSDPDCMSCHRAVERSFLCDYVGSGWVNGAYKKYQSKVMFDKEMARMPSAQPAAKRHLDIAAKEIEIQGIKQQIRVMQMKCHAAQSEKWNLKLDTPLVKKQFMQKCGVDGCLGSLSTAWKCGLCDTFSCSSCHAVKGLDRNAPHVCNTDDIASVAEIKKSTKNCPSCSASIFKIEGCDQMFCTVPGCETPFSFRTGLKETGIIHNPHFFEAQRAGLLAGEGVARAPGDRLCGGIPSVNLIEILVEKAYEGEKGHQLGEAFKHKLSQQVMTTVRGSAHFSAVIVDPLRARLAAATDNEDLRVEFLLKLIGEKKLKSTLARRDKKRQQDQAVLHIMELFSTVLQEELRTIARGSPSLVWHRHADGRINYTPYPHLPKKFDDVAAEEIKHDMESSLVKIERVRTYCNEQLLKIASDFKVMAKVIPEDPSTLMRV